MLGTGTLERFFSLIKRAISAESDAAKENATVSEPTKKKKATGATKVDTLRGEEIRLTALDHPGSSKSPQFNKIPGSKFGRSKVKNTQNKATQMRHNLSTQRLQGNEDIDDDVRKLAFDRSSCVSLFSRISLRFQSPSLDADDVGRSQKYVLVGWDNFRSKLMIILLVLFILWAVIYFPLARI